MANRVDSIPASHKHDSVVIMSMLARLQTTFSARVQNGEGGNHSLAFVFGCTLNN